MKKVSKLKLHALVYMLTIVTCSCISSFAYKQLKLPLNNDYGVPFYKDGLNDYYVDGFEIDENGNFYFLGGDNAILTCFTGTDLKFHKKFTEFKASQIYILDDKLYLFDYMFEKNNLFTLDKNSGNVISEYHNIIENRVNSFLFRDTCLIFELFNNQRRIDIDTELGFTLFDLKGRFIKQVDNPYNLPNNLNPSRVAQYLGKWMDNFVYWDYDIDKRLYKFILKNNKSEIISTQDIDESFFGKSFYGNPIEHKKLRNGNIYILGHDEKNAIITELPLKELFHFE